MSRSKELVFNTVIIGIGKFASKILNILLLPLYTSLLTTEEYGIYDLLLTCSAFIVPIVTLLMEESMFRFLIDCEKEVERKSVISNTVIYILITTVIFSIFFLVINFFIDIPYKFLFFVYIIVSILECLKNALARGLSQIKLFSISNFINSMIIILFNILLIVVFKKGISSLLISYIIANIVTFLIVICKLNIKDYIDVKLFNKKQLKEMIKYSVPLVPNSLSWTIINLSDRIVISSFIGTTANGIYSVANKFPTMVDTIYGFFYTAWKESAAKNLKYDDSEDFYNKVYVTLKNFMWAVTIMLIAVLPFVFNIFIKKDFVSGFNYIPLLILSIYFANISGFYGGIYTAYKDTKIMGITTIIAASLNIVINLLFVKKIGLWAAVISTFIANFVVYIYRKIKLKKYIRLDENLVKMILSIIFLTLVICAYYSANKLIQLMVLLVISIYSIYNNKEIINMILNKLKKRTKG